MGAVRERNPRLVSLVSIADPVGCVQLLEITLGRILGRGGFCSVSEVTKITLKKREVNGDMSTLHIDDIDDDDHLSTVVQGRSFMAKYCIRSGKDCRYAIKRMQHTTDASTFVNAVVDLAMEARYLAVIRHANIIKMRATEAVHGPYSPHYFIVLDRLYDILTTRLVTWGKTHKFKGMKKLLADRSGKKELACFIERLTVAYDLSSALKYLHNLQ
jgi:hypothetical protein